MYRIAYSLLVVCVFLFTGCQSDPSSDRPSAEESQILFQEDFDGMEDGTQPDGWWIEGGETWAVRDGRLHIEADPGERGEEGYVATVWNREKFSGDVQVEFDAQVVTSTDQANNINFFLLYTHPDEGKTLWGTRSNRASADYGLYHKLNGYISTFVRSSKEGQQGQARFRLRRCPGFELLTEKWTYNSEQGRTYHITITKVDSTLTYKVDGQTFLQAQDGKYNWTEGHMGFRTFMTHLWVDNFVVRRPQ